MPAQLTTAEYKRRIKVKFPHITVKEKYSGSNQELLHWCKTHKLEFLTTPFNMYHPRNKTSGCPECKRETYGTTIRALRSVNPRYGTSALHPKTFAERLTKKFPNIELITGYVTGNIAVTIKCGTCDKQNAVIPGRLLKVGCPYCAKLGRSTYKNYEYKLGNKRVLVQGFEPIALDWLKQKFPNRRIEVFSEGKIQPVKYKFEKKEREYWPDIKLGNTVVEVKSTHTLLDEFEKNKAKALACVKLGLSFKLLVCSKAPDKVKVLPEDWTEHTADYIRFFYLKNKEYITTLGVDPGTSNMGFGIVRTYKDGSHQIVANGMVTRTLKSMAGKDIQERMSEFREEIKSIVEFYGVDTICVERFMSRGLKGTTIELVAVMSAIMAQVRPILMIIPAQWKNQWNKHACLEDFYKLSAVVAHQIDALSIGMYGACTILGFPYFTNVRANTLKYLAKTIEETSEERLINRRHKEPIHEKRTRRSSKKETVSTVGTSTRTRKKRTTKESAKPAGRTKVRATRSTRTTKSRTRSRKG